MNSTLPEPPPPSASAGLPALTDRQRREREYHKGHAALLHASPLKTDVLYSPQRRWWNAYWDMWTYVRSLNLIERRVLVVGCGAGEDAILFAKLGARVSAFDLSPEMLAVARVGATVNGVGVDFDEMPSENLAYQDGTFDLIFARDILHHVDIPQTMKELVRVAKPGALFIADEIYSHSVTNRIRRAGWVEKWLYPQIKKIIYRGESPYITRDERKMTERDIGAVKDCLATITCEKYFNFLVTRIFPNSNIPLSKLDRIFLTVVGRRLGRLIGGRILLVGTCPIR